MFKYKKSFLLLKGVEDMEKVLNEILSELKEIKAAQLTLQEKQEAMIFDNEHLKREVTYLKDGQQEKNTLIKHALTLQIENMLEIRNSLRSLENDHDSNHSFNQK
jgi:regulator of replication initiation timing